MLFVAYTMQSMMGTLLAHSIVINYAYSLHIWFVQSVDLISILLLNVNHLARAWKIISEKKKPKWT